MPHGGARPGAGRKRKAEKMGLEALLNECWTEDDRRLCIIRLAELAKSGEIESVKLLMAYTFGKPKERIEHTGKDGGPIAVEQVKALPDAELHAIASSGRARIDPPQNGASIH